jgi:hypothetical protein
MTAGTLTNTGTIISQDTAGGMTSAAHEIVGDLSNSGTITVNTNLKLNGTSLTNQAGGQINVADTQTLILTGGTFDNNGTITLLGGSSATTLDLTGLTAFNNNSGSSLTGSGTILNSDVISGQGTFSVSAGASPGVLRFDGDLDANLALEMELKGTQAGSQHDQVIVDGVAQLRGSMNVLLLNSYLPKVSDVFVVFTAGTLIGSFDSVAGLDVSNSVVLDLNYDSNNIELVALETTFAGSQQSDIIVGSSLRNVITAGAGDDVITSLGDQDIIYAQAGDDQITVGTEFKRVDGGAGVDTLVVSEDFDYREIQGTRIDRVEIITLDDEDADVIDLDAKAIARIVDGDNDLTGIENSLIVLGNDGDEVRLEGDFASSGEMLLDAGRGEELFRLYTDGEATLLLSDEILLKLTPNTERTHELQDNDVASSEVADGLVNAAIEMDILLENSINLDNVSSLTNEQKLEQSNEAIDVADLLDDEGDMIDGSVLDDVHRAPDNAVDNIVLDPLVLSAQEGLMSNSKSTLSPVAEPIGDLNYISLIDFSNNLLASSIFVEANPYL